MRLLTIALCVVALACGWACGGTTRDDSNPPPPEVYVGAYLAPGALAELPTTARIGVSVRDSLLPVNGFTIDPDGEGDAAPVQVVEFQQFGKRGMYTNFYFDFEWEGPDGTRGVVSVTTAGGTFGGIVELTLDQLPPWPH